MRFVLSLFVLLSLSSLQSCSAVHHLRRHLSTQHDARERIQQQIHVHTNVETKSTTIAQTYTQTMDVFDQQGAASDVAFWRAYWASLNVVPGVARPTAAGIVDSDLSVVVQQTSDGATVKKQKVLLEMEADTNTDTEGQVAAPATTRPMADASLARAEIRGGAGVAANLDANSPAAASYHLQAGGGFNGRVWGASWQVQTTVNFGAGALAEQFCNTIWNTVGFAGPAGVGTWWIEGSAASRPTYLWEIGHIIAGALGGLDNDPLNFFPQHRRSNRDNSVWWRMELIAGAVRAYLIPQCVVRAYITFTYGGPNAWVPDGGTYEVRVSAACYARLAALGGLNAYATAFVNSAAVVGASAGAGYVPAKPAGRALSVNWVNGPNIAIAAPPAAGGALVALSPEYQVAAALF